MDDIYFEYHVKVGDDYVRETEVKHLTIFGWKTPIVLSLGKLKKYSKQDAIKTAKELNGRAIEQPYDPEGWHIFFPKYLT